MPIRDTTPVIVNCPWLAPEKPTLASFGHPIDETFKSAYAAKTLDRTVSMLSPAAAGQLRDRSLDLFNRFDLSDNHVAAHLAGAYFGNFAPAFLTLVRLRMFSPAVEVYDRLWEPIVHTWERANGRRLHLGTPYYWAGGAYLLSGRLDRGFDYMERAWESDRKLNPRDMTPPARLFFRLEAENTNQAFKPYVEQHWRSISNRWESYARRADARRNRGLAANGRNAYIPISADDLRRAVFQRESDDHHAVRINVMLATARLRDYPFLLPRGKTTQSQLEGIVWCLAPLAVATDQVLSRHFTQRFLAEKVKALLRPGPSGIMTGRNRDRMQTSTRQHYRRWLTSHLKKKSIASDYELLVGIRNLTFHNILSAHWIATHSQDLAYAFYRCFIHAVAYDAQSKP